MADITSSLPIKTATNGDAVVKLVDTGGTNIAGVNASNNLQVKVNEALPTGTNNIGDVDVLTVPAPLSTTGGGTEATALRVTLANDSTGVVSVDDNGTALTVDNAGTFAVQSTLQTGDNTAGRFKVTDGTTVAGVDASSTGLHVKVNAALPAGTNNIGDVDVLTIVNPTNATASGALGAANDAVTVSGQGTGVIHWEVDTGTLSGTVSFEATLDDTNWFAVNVIELDTSAAISSITSYGKRGSFLSSGYSQVRMRVSAYTSGTSNGRLEASAGDQGVVRIAAPLPAGTNAIGKLTANSGVDIGDVTIDNASGAAAVNIQDGGNSITVDGTVSVSGAVDTELPAAGALTDNTTNPTTTSVGTFPHWYDGATWDRAKGDSTDGLLVNLGANNDISGTVTANIGTSGSLALEATLGSVKTAVELIDDAVYTEDTAAAAANKGIAILAVRRDADTSLVDTDNDFAQLQVNATGALKVTGGTQYTEADVDTTITGTAFLWEDTGDTLRAVSAAKPLPVDITDASVAVTKSGTWTLDSNSGVDIGDVTINNTEAAPIPVYITGAVAGGEVHEYDTSAAVAASADHTGAYTVTAGKTLMLKQITASASGKIKVVLKTGPVATLATKGVWFTSSANPYVDITLAQPIEIPSTSTGTVQLVCTNLESSAMDIYSTIIGNEQTT